MPPSTPSYMNPEVLSKVGRLGVRARLVVEGFISGMHKSPFHGFSVEFAEHREYVPGDEIRHIDWKVWARADRYYIKQYEEETNMNCHLLLDCSRSMHYGAEGRLGSKFACGATLAAALAYLLQRQQDAISLTLFDQGIRTVLPPSSHPRHVGQIVHVLEQNEPDHRTDADAVFPLLVKALPRRGLVALISDFFLDPDLLETTLRQIRHQRHEVVLFHTLDADELTFPFEGNTQFVGLELAGELMTDPRALRKSYLQAVEAFRHRVRSICANCGCDYLLLNTAEPLAGALSAYLVARQRMARVLKG